MGLKHNILRPLSLLVLLAMLSRASVAEDSPKALLDEHNKARAAVGVPPLTWNETLAAAAAKFADKVKATCDNSLKSHGPYGVNIASGYEAMSTNGAINTWVSQGGSYNPATNTCAMGADGCKGYTQVVWKDTRRVGCASILCGAGWPYVVCEYDPPGNVPGKKPY